MEILNLTTNQLNQNGYTKNTLTKGKIGALYTFPTLYICNKFRVSDEFNVNL